MEVFDLKNTKAEVMYKGCGKGFITLRGEEDAPEIVGVTYTMEDCNALEASNGGNTQNGGDCWSMYGMISCYEFCRPQTKAEHKAMGYK